MPGVHAVAGMRNPKMRGIAADEDTAVLEAIRHETAADPVLLGDHLVFELRPDPENRTDRPVAVDGIEFRLAVVEEIVDEPALLAVDRHHRAAAARIEREIHPRRLAGQQALERWRAEIGRLHALDDRNAGQLRAHAVADRRTRAVAADEVSAGDRDARATVEIAGDAGDAVLVLGERLEFGAVEDANARMRRGLREQDRLQVRSG